VPVTVKRKEPVGVEDVVVMLSVALTFVPVVETGFGLKVGVVPVGSPLVIASDTLHCLLFPPTVIWTVYEAALPRVTVTDEGMIERLWGFESVKVVVAIPDTVPVAVTVYVATNQSGSWKLSARDPCSSATTSVS
jgi:hypothetical protein